VSVREVADVAAALLGETLQRRIEWVAATALAA
jgi:hypothetical protein